MVLCTGTVRPSASIRTADRSGLISSGPSSEGVVVVSREEGGRGFLALSP